MKQKLYSGSPTGVICANDHLLEGLVVYDLWSRFPYTLYSDVIPVRWTEQWTEVISEGLKDLPPVSPRCVFTNHLRNVFESNLEANGSIVLWPEGWALIIIPASNTEQEPQRLDWLHNRHHKDVHILIPGTWEHARFHGKKGIKISDGIKVANQLTLT